MTVLIEWLGLVHCTCAAPIRDPGKLWTVQVETAEAAPIRIEEVELLSPVEVQAAHRGKNQCCIHTHTHNGGGKSDGRITL